MMAADAGPLQDARALVCWQELRSVVESCNCPLAHVVRAANTLKRDRPCSLHIGWQLRCAHTSQRRQCSGACQLPHPTLEETYDLLCTAFAQQEALGPQYAVDTAPDVWPHPLIYVRPRSLEREAGLALASDFLAAKPQPPPLHIFLDFAFDDAMDDREIRSLVVQASLCRAIEKQSTFATLELTSLRADSRAHDGLERSWHEGWSSVRKHDASASERAAALSKRLVYLSPDAPEPLRALEPGSVYAIGALVDRGGIKLTLPLAESIDGCEARRLPIREVLPGLADCVAQDWNVHTVFAALVQFRRLGSWRPALMSAARSYQRKKPSRRRADEADMQAAAVRANVT